MRYVPFGEDKQSVDVGVYRTYGIKGVNERGEVVVAISDISTQHEFVEELANRCTRGNLSPHHLRDVVEDELNSGSLV